MPFPQARTQGSGSGLYALNCPACVRPVDAFSLFVLLSDVVWQLRCVLFMVSPTLCKGQSLLGTCTSTEPVRAYDCVFSVVRGLRCLHLFSAYPGRWEEWSSHNNNCNGERPCGLPWISASEDCACTHSFSWRADIQGLQRERSTLFSTLKESSRKDMMVPGCVLPRHDTAVHALSKGCGWQVESVGMHTGFYI